MLFLCYFSKRMGENCMPWFVIYNKQTHFNESNTVLIVIWHLLSWLESTTVEMLHNRILFRQETLHLLTFQTASKQNLLTNEYTNHSNNRKYLIHFCTPQLNTYHIICNLLLLDEIAIQQLFISFVYHWCRLYELF